MTIDAKSSGDCWSFRSTAEILNSAAGPSVKIHRRNLVFDKISAMFFPGVTGVEPAVQSTGASP